MGRRRLAIAPLLLSALLLGGGAAAPAAAHAAAPAPYCGITWGSLEKTAQLVPSPDHTVQDVRAGRHECFDRLVVDLAGHGDLDAYSVRYVPEVTQPGSGFAVPLRGGAALQVVVGAPAHDRGYSPTFAPADRDEAVDVTGFTTFRQVALAGSFEGVTDLGLGVRARLPFRVFTLPGADGSGARLVVDVAHRWS